MLKKLFIYVTDDIVNPRKRRKTIIYSIKCILFCIFIFSLSSFIGYTKTDSVGFRFFFHIPVNKIRVNKYYLFNASEGNRDLIAVKQAMCLPNQTVTRNGNFFYCDGEIIGNLTIHEYDSNGNKLTTFNGGFLDNQVFMLGAADKSYDSRYFGGVEVNSLFREVIPIW